ncbi:hypothetical protein HPHPH10_0088 [Helicobacter pylori Hp H-10]|nr:hypothetical protein HPHPH10_0088 [Helicobacter pylori Hp H-10]
MILIQAIAFKKSAFFGGFSGAKRGRMVSKIPPTSLRECVFKHFKQTQ